MEKDVAGFAVLGAVVGAVLGFLFRPSVPFVGQLPYDVVITRGANLTGLDTLLRSTAEQSFNYIVIGAILGAVILGATKAMVSSNAAALATPPPLPGGQTDAFCTKCGKPLAPDVVFCGFCGTQRS